MSINQFYSREQQQQQQQQQNQVLWWQQQMDPSNSSPSSDWHPQPHPPPHPSWLSAAVPTALNLNLNNNQEEEEEEEEDEENSDQLEKSSSPSASASACSSSSLAGKQAMFEKPLTPSDVGKLNRLVIPKQHAERYFPLGADTVDKGLLLSFEDESGKCWRFRYSYWNSSQSYVLTKGWSRYVKDKHLQSGDVVLFHRHPTDAHRLFIAWKRGPGAHTTPTPPPNNNNIHIHNKNNNTTSTTTATTPPPQPYLDHGGGAGGRMMTSSVNVNVPYHSLHAPTTTTTTTTTGKEKGGGGGNSKRLRLFGVNMEWQPENEQHPSSSPSSMAAAPDQFTTTNHPPHPHHPHTSGLHMPTNYSHLQHYYSHDPAAPPAFNILNNINLNNNNSSSSSSTGQYHIVRYT